MPQSGRDPVILISILRSGSDIPTLHLSNKGAGQKVGDHRFARPHPYIFFIPKVWDWRPPFPSLLLARLSLFVLFPDQLHVLPHCTLALRVAQEEGGVVGGHELGALVGVEFAPEQGDPLLGLQQSLGGEGSEGANDLGPDGLQLLAEKGKAGSDLIGLRVAVLRGAAFHDVGDVYFFSRQVYGLDDAGEERSCLPDKGSPLQVLFPARGLSYKDEHGMGVALAEDQALSPLMETAPGAIPYRASCCLEGQGCA